MASPRCACCGDRCVWSDTAWVCVSVECGSEWGEDHGGEYAAPGERFIVSVAPARIGLPTCYWYGPDEGWGTTSSTDLRDPRVARFPTSKAANDALRRTFQTLPAARHRRYVTVPYEIARLTFDARKATR